MCLTSFCKFPDILPGFTCARAIGNLWSMCFRVNILIQVAKSEGSPLHFSSSVKSRIFSTILATFVGLSFSGIS